MLLRCLCCFIYSMFPFIWNRTDFCPIAACIQYCCIWLLNIIPNRVFECTNNRYFYYNMYIWKKAKVSILLFYLCLNVETYRFKTIKWYLFILWVFLEKILKYSKLTYKSSIDKLLIMCLNKVRFFFKIRSALKLSTKLNNRKPVIINFVIWSDITKQIMVWMVLWYVL